MAKQSARTEDKTFHELTAEEIRRQAKDFSDRRDAVVAELAAIFRARQGGQQTEPPVNDKARAVHERARQLLNGSAPAGFALPRGPSREQELEVERGALDMILVTLAKSEVQARATDSLKFAERHRPRWRELVGEIISAALRITQLNDELYQISLGIDGARMPLDAYFGGRLDIEFSGVRLREILADAVAAGFVSPGEKAEAERALWV